MYFLFYLFCRVPENVRQDKYPVDLLSVCPTNPRLTLMVFDHRLLLSYDSSTNEVLGTSVFDVQCKVSALADNFCKVSFNFFRSECSLVCCHSDGDEFTVLSLLSN